MLATLLEDADRVQAEAAATELCDWVGHLPLGIELVGRYLAVNPTVSFAKLLGRLEEKRLGARALRQVPDEMAYELTIAAAFDLSWQQLGAGAKTVAGLLSQFALDPISRSS